MNLTKVIYEELNPKAKEIYNFQKVSAKLADYGFSCMWLNNDWKGADFIAVHIDGVTDLKIQLKGRLSFAKKYVNKNLYICFIAEGQTYLYPHDKLLELCEIKISDKTWIKKGTWSTPRLSIEFKELLKSYML